MCPTRRDLAIECMSMFFIENLASMDTHTHTDACCHSCLSTLDRRSAASTCTDKLSIKQQSNGTRGKRQGQRAQHDMASSDGTYFSASAGSPKDLARTWRASPRRFPWLATRAIIAASSLIFVDAAVMKTGSATPSAVNDRGRFAAGDDASPRYLVGLRME